MHLRVALLAARATARAMPWGPMGAAVATVVAVLAVARPWALERPSLSVARVVLTLVALGAAFTLDDQAATTLASSPTPLRWRRTVRVGWALLAAAVVAVAGVAATGAASGRVAVEGAALVVAGLACGAALGGDRGSFALAGGVLGALAVQARWPALALFPPGPGPAWSGSFVVWWAAAATAAATLVVLSRDPQRVP